MTQPADRSPPSNPHRSRSGLLRRAFGRLGPSWQASPWRRVVQVAGLALFLYLFLYVAWPYSDTFPSDLNTRRRFIPLESFLWADPLAGLAAAVAARALTPSLLGGLAVLLLCLFHPRAFCGWLCPLGTLIDLCDRLVPRRAARWGERLTARCTAGPVCLGRVRFHLLEVVLVAAVLGVMLAGYVAAIPVLTRGLLFSLGRLQLGLGTNWGLVPPVDFSLYLAVGLFTAILVLAVAGRRFWCRNLCPTGALISLFSFLRLRERHVNADCVKCNRCREACDFDAVREDFSTRPLNCTSCRACAGVCPTGAISFRFRARRAAFAAATSPTTGSPDPSIAPPVSRRAFLLSGAAGAAAAATVRYGLYSARESSGLLIRPPGSAPESDFLRLCLRCGECVKVCPGPVLQPAGLKHGLEALWTPVAVFTHAGCHPGCNFCTQVCPTHAIRPLTVKDKRRIRIGLAEVDPALCLAHTGRQECTLCHDECQAAGYDAIHLRTIDLHVGDIPEGAVSEEEIREMSRIRAPLVVPARCVGCGLCERRCHAAFVARQGLLPEAAIRVTSQGEQRVP